MDEEDYIQYVEKRLGASDLLMEARKKGSEEFAAFKIHLALTRDTIDVGFAHYQGFMKGVEYILLKLKEIEDDSNV